MNAIKKRKVDSECRLFNEQWTPEYFFVESKNMLVCLICGQTVAVRKEFNVKRHYQTQHAAKFDEYNGQLRKDRIQSLKTALSRQQTLFTKVSKDVEYVVKASFEISEIIARKLKPFSDGEFIKQCIDAAVDCLCPEKKQLFSSISLSRMTVGRRIGDLADNIEAILKERAENFDAYSICLDESTDMTDTAQLAIFVRGVDNDFNITEELLKLASMKGTTTGIDIFEEVKDALKENNLGFLKLTGITTDGAPAMVGTKNGLIGLMQTELEKSEITTQLIASHCIIHQENLCAKQLKMDHVMSVVVKTVNFIRARGLNHRQFKEFLGDIEAEYSDVIYYSEVRWLSRGKVLHRFYNLRKEILLFMEMKEKTVQELLDDNWILDLAFLVDITNHLNNLNTALQGKDQLVNNLYDHVKAFQAKLKLWENQLSKSNTVHFSSLTECKTHENLEKVKKYTEQISILRTEFSSRFSDFAAHEHDFKLFSDPFNFNAETAPDSMQMELIELQCNSDLQRKHHEVSLVQFYKLYVSQTTFPSIRCHALKMVSLFPSTYICEQFFSKMKLTKSKNRCKLTDDNLSNQLRVATSNIKANTSELCKDKKSQVSH